jgi:hypothetical protein
MLARFRSKASILNTRVTALSAGTLVGGGSERLAA